MNLKIWSKYEEIRDSYIIEGIPRKKAEKYAKKDCKNFEDKETKEKINKILNKELEEAAILEGDYKNSLTKNREESPRF